MRVNTIFTVLLIFIFNVLNAQSEEIRLVEIKTTSTDRQTNKTVRVNYNYKFAVGDGPFDVVGKNASHLEKYITDRRAKNRFDKCVKQTKTANLGSNLSWVGAGLVVLGVLVRKAPEPNEEKKYGGYVNVWTIGGTVTAVIGLNMRSILQKKARESLKECVSMQNNSRSNSGLKFNLDDFNVGYNPDIKAGQVGLSFNF